MAAPFNPDTTMLSPTLPPPPPPVTTSPASISSRVKVKIAATSHPGKVRKNNEDHFLTARYGRSAATLQTNLPPGQIPALYEETGYALVVADGMGGTAAGEVASRMAITVAVNLALVSPQWHLGTTPEENEAEEKGRGGSDSGRWTPSWPGRAGPIPPSPAWAQPSPSAASSAATCSSTTWAILGPICSGAASS
jgi:hypothetical protein